jgi:hypothetical protein
LVSLADPPVSLAPPHRASQVCGGVQAKDRSGEQARTETTTKVGRNIVPG